jgi:phosphatidylglycerophosphate synthase
MEGNTANLLILLAFMALFLLAAFAIQGLLVRRAAFQVIKIFRKNHSLCSEGYKTIEELGLQPPSFMERMFHFGLRDFKPFALQALIQAGVVRDTSDGKVCLLDLKSKKFGG